MASAAADVAAALFSAMVLDSAVAGAMDVSKRATDRAHHGSSVGPAECLAHQPCSSPPGVSKAMAAAVSSRSNGSPAPSSMMTKLSTPARPNSVMRVAQSA